MKNDKARKIIIWTVVIVAGMTLAEIGIRALLSSTRNFVAKKNEEKIQEEKYNSLESQTEREIYDFILSLIEAANNNDYSYIMENVDSNYSACFFSNNIDNLKSYFEENIPNTDEMSLVDLSTKGYIYKAIVSFGSGSNYTTRTFSLVNRKDGYEVMFGDYDSVNWINMTTLNNGIEYTIRYKYVTNNIVSYMVDIENILDEKVKIEINNTKLVLSNGKEVKGNNEYTIELDSNNTQAIEMFFTKTDYGVYHIKMDVYINEKEYNLQLRVN